MVPTYATIPFERLAGFIVDVDTYHLISGQALTTHTATEATATAWETHIIGIVGIQHRHHGQFAIKLTTHDSVGITVLGSCCQIYITHDAMVHSWFYSKVEHSLVIAVFYATYSC
jgi:hypothetical protein